MQDGMPPSAWSAATRLRWTRWTALGFLVGSALFAVGVPLSLPSDINLSISAWTYFVGSVFFTAAGSIQLLISVRELRAERQERGHWPSWHEAGGLDVCASLVQWFGTIAFNVSTLRGALQAADRVSSDPHVVWAPDAYGSVLFLVASAVALAPEVRSRRHGHARDRSWDIAALNMAGSVFFGLSAIGAYTDPTTNELLNVAWANWGTLLGALCFLLGAAMLLPLGVPRAAKGTEN